MGLFSTANEDSQIGVDFLADGVAVVQVQAGKKNGGRVLRSEFVAADGQDDQVDALRDWVRANGLQKSACVCLLADDDRDIYQVEKPEVEDGEMIQAVTWKIKDLINYDVANAVVDSYPIPESSKNNKQQVGVVAAREAVVASYVESIRSSGMNLIALDVHELVRSNLQAVRNSAGQTLALLSLDDNGGLLSVYHDSDLYVSRDFKLGLNQLSQADELNTDIYDSLLLEIQRSLDYYESYYGHSAVTDLRIFPQVQASEKLAMYLQNLTNFDIDFVVFGGEQGGGSLDQHCFHAYCAALRGVGQ